MGDRHSIFEQLTPADDALRDDLAWFDSLLGDAETRDKTHGGCGKQDSDTVMDEIRDGSAPSTTPRIDAAAPPADDMPEPAQADTLDLASVADTADEPDRPTRPGMKTLRIVAFAAVVIVALLLCALAVLHIGSSARQDAADRLESSMSRLETWTSKSRSLLDQADEAGLEDQKDVESLRSQAETNRGITRRDRTALNASEADALADTTDKAVKRTRNLYSKVSDLIKAKPLEDAKAKCSSALDEAKKAAAGATASDDATRTALDTLNGLIAEADGLGDDATAQQWTETASKLDQARDALKALAAKAKADEDAKAKADAENQAQSEPQAGAQSEQQYTAPQYTEGSTAGGNGSGTQSEGSTDTGANGWYVPPATGDDGLPDNDSSL